MQTGKVVLDEYTQSTIVSGKVVEEPASCNSSVHLS